MSKYTNEQIRGAILRAADRIESAPSCYDFYKVRTPKSDCGTQACMWGWIGHELGIGHDVSIKHVAEAVGVSDTWDLYEFCKHQTDVERVPQNLRSYADAKFPESRALVRYQDPNQIVDWASCAWKPEGVREGAV